MTLIDTNVLLDILKADAKWLAWSAQQLAQRRMAGPLYINEITYAEISVGVATEAELCTALSDLDIQLERTAISALFIAGKAFGRYRAAGGPRTSLLPDFFIGAHAQVAKVPLLTRDVRRYRAYFPGIELITPEA